MPTKLTKDGRTIHSGESYSDFRRLVGEMAEQRCSRCGANAPVQSEDYPIGHCHHRRGRGGGKRNDIPEECDWLCWKCHAREHGQICNSKLHWSKP